jgi:diguanylate cyclase
MRGPVVAHAGAGSTAAAATSQATVEVSSLDPVTGLHTGVSFEQQLGKEIARARRQGTTLCLATLHVDDLTDITSRLGKSAVDAAFKELARYLKKASRGSDVAARLCDEDFLLLLPECSVTEVKQVLNRVPSVEVTAAGKRIPLTYTTGWVDYQAGDLPADLLKRATSLLHLYDSAAKDSSSVVLR